MKANVYNEVDHHDSLGDEGWIRIQKICFDKRVHIIRSWASTEEKPHFHERWLTSGPCDGSCVRELDIPHGFEPVIESFLATGANESEPYQLTPEN